MSQQKLAELVVALYRVYRVRNRLHWLHLEKRAVSLLFRYRNGQRSAGKHWCWPELVLATQKKGIETGFPGDVASLFSPVQVQIDRPTDETPSTMFFLF